jgi:hypothetical protein
MNKMEAIEYLNNFVSSKYERDKLEINMTGGLKLGYRYKKTLNEAIGIVLEQANLPEETKVYELLKRMVENTITEEERQSTTRLAILSIVNHIEELEALKEKLKKDIEDCIFKLEKGDWNEIPIEKIEQVKIYLITKKGYAEELLKMLECDDDE